MGYYPGTRAISQISSDSNLFLAPMDPTVSVRGIFNVRKSIRDNISMYVKNNFLTLDGTALLLGFNSLGIGYNIDQSIEGGIPTLKLAAQNLIKHLFSSKEFSLDTLNISIIENAPGNNPLGDSRFNIEATYKSPQNIPGTDYKLKGCSLMSLGVARSKNAGTFGEAKGTNRIHVTVGVSDGRIYIATLYPIVETPVPQKRPALPSLSDNTKKRR